MYFFFVGKRKRLKSYQLSYFLTFYNPSEWMMSPSCFQQISLHKSDNFINFNLIHFSAFFINQRKTKQNKIIWFTDLIFNLKISVLYCRNGYGLEICWFDAEVTFKCYLSFGKFVFTELPKWFFYDDKIMIFFKVLYIFWITRRLHNNYIMRVQLVKNVVDSAIY